jgi:hypothetical protein
MFRSGAMTRKPLGWKIALNASTFRPRGEEAKP